MAFRIPITVDTQEFNQIVELDGSTYTLAFSFSERTATWYLSLYYLDNGVLVPVLLGVALVADVPLLAGVTHPNRPLGDLAVRVLGASRDPGETDLTELVYI